jgi:tRNA (guanosine-2'-O-)-methyltransferase
LDVADVRAIIPMAGFTKSFNISVAAALCLYHVQQDRIRRLGRHGDLDEETMRVLRALYYIRTVPNADRVLLDQRKRAGSP